jgi:hypothetical protein
MLGTTNFALGGAMGAIGAIGGPIMGAVAGVGALASTGLVKLLGDRPSAGQKAFKRLVLHLSESDQPVHH